MKRTLWTLLAISAVTAAAAPATAQSTEEFISDVAARTRNALVTVSGTVETEDGSVPISGLGVCIEPSGIFVSTAFSTRMQMDTLKDFVLNLTGDPRGPVPAEMLGVDPETGLGFLQATEDRDWQAVSFAREADVSPGQPVVSAGLFNAPGQPRCFGVAYVSSVLRMPEKLVYVTGGTLTLPGSPVFTRDGVAVGIIGTQLPLRYRVEAGQTRNIVAFRGQEQTQFFTAIDEFAHVLENIPTPDEPRQLPWIGVLEFSPVPDHVARINQLDKTAVQLQQVVPDQPAHEAGLREGDIIVALNGEPVEAMPTADLTAEQFLRRLMRLRVGQTATLTIHSTRGERQVRVPVEPMPSRPQDAERYVSRPLGLVVREKARMDDFITPATRGVSGLMVVLVADNGPADQAGLQGGDLLTAVNGRSVDTVDAFRQAVEQAVEDSPGQAVTVNKYAGGESQVVPIYPQTQ